MENVTFVETLRQFRPVVLCSSGLFAGAGGPAGLSCEIRPIFRRDWNFENIIHNIL